MSTTATHDMDNESTFTFQAPSRDKGSDFLEALFQQGIIGLRTYHQLNESTDEFSVLDVDLDVAITVAQDYDIDYTYTHKVDR